MSPLQSLMSSSRIPTTLRLLALGVMSAVVGGLGVSVLTLATGCAGASREASSEARSFSFERQNAFGALLGTTVKDRVRSPLLNGLQGQECPNGMANIADRFCIDKYEGSLVEELPSGAERPFPYYSSVEGLSVRAVSRAGVFPQGYISGKQAQAACGAAGKRLCRAPEWTMACKGPKRTTYPYGQTHEAKRCNDHGVSPRQVYRRGNTWEAMNDAALNQLPGTIAKTGDHEGCKNDWDVHDMVGNLHEWVDDGTGTFMGGFYLDTNQNGEGCSYATRAHNFAYHDYSTGFRCCKDMEY
jgi:formylglycine-generating enzyme